MNEPSPKSPINQPPKTMPKKTVFLLCLCSASQLATAEKAPSMMFDPPEHAITATPPLEQQSTGDRCEELLHKIEALRGKPQRRHAVLERYRKECSQHNH
jgi:hypothetical protein